MIRLASLALGLAGLTACGGGDCLNKAQRLDCPEGSMAYGRAAPDHKSSEGFLYALADLDAWDFGDTYQTSGSCELACVPEQLGAVEDLATCDQLEPCGGEIRGDWRWQVGCPYDTPNALYQACPEAVQSNLWEVDGTLSFDTDGTWTLTSNRVQHDKVVISPPECSQSLADCQAMNVGTCEGDPATGCSCRLDETEQPIEGTGTYSVDGTNVTLVDELGVATVHAFCATEDFLVLDTPGDTFSRREYFLRWAN